MKKIFQSIFTFLLIINLASAQELKSPNGSFTMTFSLLSDGTPTYTLSYKNKAVIKSSKLGLELKNDKVSLLNAFSITDSRDCPF